MYLLSLHMDVYHICAWSLHQSDDGLTITELVVVGSCEPRVSTVNQTHLHKDQQERLNAKPSLLFCVVYL